MGSKKKYDDRSFSFFKIYINIIPYKIDHQKEKKVKGCPLRTLFSGQSVIKAAVHEKKSFSSVVIFFPQHA